MLNETSLYGHTDSIEDRRIQGWVRDASAPEARLLLSVYADHRLVGTCVAGEPRSDLEQAGFGAGDYGFSFFLPPKLMDGREHLLDIRIAETGASIPGMPRRCLLLETTLGGYVRSGGIIRGFACGPEPERKLVVLARRANEPPSEMEAVADRPSALSCALGVANADCGFEFDLSLLGIGAADRGDVEIWIKDPSIRIEPLDSGIFLDRSIEGNLEHIALDVARGWAWRPGHPSHILVIELCLDGNAHGIAYARDFREDLREAMKRDGYCGFEIDVAADAIDAKPLWLSLRAAGSDAPFYVHPAPLLLLEPQVQIERVEAGIIEAYVHVPHHPLAQIELTAKVGDAETPISLPKSQRLVIDSSPLLPATIGRETELAFEIKCGPKVLASGRLGTMVALRPDLVALCEMFDASRIKARILQLERRESPLGTARVEIADQATIGPVDAEGRLDIDLSQIACGDGEHAVRVEVALHDGRVGTFARQIAFRRYEFGFLSLSQREISGYCHDSRLPPHFVPLNILIDGVAIATVQANEALPGAPEHARNKCFSLPVSPEWYDGKAHLVQAQVVGTNAFLPSPAPTVVFGEARQLLRFDLDRPSAGELSGWVLSAAEPGAAIEVKVYNRDAVLAEAIADQTSETLAALRLPDRHGFHLSWPEGEVANPTLGFAWGAQRVTVQLPAPLDRPTAIDIVSAYAPGSGLCVVLPSVGHNGRSRQSVQSLLAVAFEATRNACQVTLCLQGFGAALSRLIDEFLGALPDESRNRVRIAALPAALPLDFDRASPIADAIRFDIWARAKAFQTIVAPARGGLLSLAVDTKAQGLGYSDTNLVVLVDELTLPDRIDNFVLVDDPSVIFADAFERRSLARADTVIFRNRAIAASAMRSGIAVSAGKVAPPPFASVVHALGSATERPTSPPVSRGTTDGKRLFVLGRAEPRHGILIVATALQRLLDAREDWIQDLTVTFLGESASVFGQDARAYLRRRLQNWPGGIELSFDASINEARSLLEPAGPARRLAIVPAEAEGTLFDEMARIFGVPRLVLRPYEVEDDDSWLSSVARNPSALAGQIKAWATSAVSVGSNSAADGQETWRKLFRSARRKPKAPRPASRGRRRLPLVSVCVSHFNRPSMLWQTLRSIAANDYPSIEIMVTDDGSTWDGMEAEGERVRQWLEARNGRLLRQENRYLGAARNNAVRHAAGDLIVFMDDDNLARPDMVSTFVEGRRKTGADALTSLFFVFHGNALIDPEKTWPSLLWAPLGPDPVVGTITNCFGDANMMITRPAFEAIGGFTEDYGSTHEDWELLARLCLGGFRIERLTVPLFWYRLAPDSMVRSTEDAAMNLLRNIRAYRDGNRPELYRLALLTQGLLRRNERFGQAPKRDLSATRDGGLP